MTAPALVARNLTAGYRKGRTTTPIVTTELLTARRGDLVAVIGPNGAGKSTLLRTLIGTQPALAGWVELDGTPLGALDRGERARRTAVVLTDRIDAGLLSVGDVIALGRHPHTDWRGHLTPDDLAVARAAADRLGVGSLWGRPFTELSDGQRQRVMVARALAQEPSLLVLDEPTAFLDVTGRVELTAALAALAHVGGLAVVVSTHDLDLALAHADRVWLVHDGRIVDTSPESLVADGTLAAAFDSDLVALDPVTGTFRDRPGAPRQPVVTPSPLVARLVTRLGGRAVTDTSDLDPTDRAVAWHVVAGPEGWELVTDRGRETATTVDELAQRLRSRLGEPHTTSARLTSR